MTKQEEFICVLAEHAIIGNRINGFNLREDSVSGIIIIQGQIPLSLARLMFDGADKEEISLQNGTPDWTPDSVAINAELHNQLSYPNLTDELSNNIRTRYIAKKDAANESDELYILHYLVKTPDRLRHVLACIKEGEYINQCLFDA